MALDLTLVVLKYEIRPGIKVKSWAFDEDDDDDNQRPVDEFFTIYLDYHGRNVDVDVGSTGTLKLKRDSSSSDWQMDIMGWLAMLNVDVDAWDCTINVVVESCDSLLRAGRKSLDFKVEVFEHEQVEDNSNNDIDIDTESFTIEKDCKPLYSSDTDDIKFILQDSGVRFGTSAHSPTMNNNNNNNNYCCSICLEEFGTSNDNNDVATLPCSHIYHEKCVIRWVFQGKQTCPLCRLEIKAKASVKL